MEAEEQKQVVVGDSVEAQELARLNGYRHDLAEARRALEIGAAIAGEDREDAGTIHNHLVASAVIAYGRCFTPSNVRQRLDRYIPIPADLAATHDQLMKLRNRTVAHSESESMISLAVADLTSRDGSVELTRVGAMAFSGPLMPKSSEMSALALIDQLERDLLGVIEDAKTALAASLDQGELQRLWNEGKPAQLMPRLVSEWNPNTRRAPYPDSHEIPVFLFEDPRD